MITLGQAVLYLIGNREGLDQTLDQAEASTKSWAGNLATNVNTLVSGALLAGGAAVATGIIAIGGIAINTADQVATAQGKIQAQLRLSDQEANAFGQTVKNIYGNNFGDSIEDVGAALATTAAELGRVGVTAQEELGKATENAIALRDAFEVEVNESTNAAAALMDNLGLSSQEAFDMIAAGLQDPRINNEDFLDTVREYSNLFGDAGFSAEQMYNILATGSEAGVLATDKIADSIKEFGIIMNEQTDASQQALRDIGIDYDDMIAQVGSGAATWGDYFDEIVGAINEVDDPLKRSQAQVAIFGTMAEDLGVSFTEGLSSVGTTLDDIAGSTDALNAQYNTMGSFLEGLKRRAQVGLEPLGRIALTIANNALPFVSQGLEKIFGFIDQIGRIASRAFGEFFLVLEEGGTPLQALLGFIDQLLYDLGLSEEEIAKVKETILALAGAIQNGIAAAVEFFTAHAEEFKGALIAIGAVLAGAAIVAGIGAIVGAIGTLLSPIGLVVAAVGLLGAAWAGNWGGIRDKVTAVIDFLRPYIEAFIAWLTAYWDQNGAQILATARLAWETILAVIRETLERIKERIDFYLTLARTIFSAFRSAFEGDWTAFGATLRQAWDMIWNDIKTRLEAAKTALANTARNLVESIKEKFTGFNWGELGQQIITGIANAISAGAGAIADAARAAAQAALDAAKAFLGIESPSKVAGEEIGDPFIMGIAKRIAAGADRLKQAGVTAVRGALSGAASRVATTATNYAAAQAPISAPQLAGAGGAGPQYIFHIDARGAAPGTAAQIKAAVKEAIDELTTKADVKRRTRST
jgi:phage-related minor tail protein